jgi:GNAT superfamily N-acetyltransferase
MAHKLSVEQGAAVRRVGDITQIIHSGELHHPWPREFSYQIEFLASGDLVGVMSAIKEALGGERPEHVLSLFAADKRATFRAATEGGYRHAWSNVLMGYRLQEERDSSLPSEHAEMKEIRTPEDLEAVNALAPDFPTWPASLDDPFLHNYVAIENGRVAAKAQVVTLPGDVAYVADMFTIPDARRHGLGRTLLEQLHHVAWKNGATTVVLIPSQMTREIHFFERFGYQELIPILVLALAAPSTTTET